MSETDSFIDEVTEEVRRDRLYALLRRYGWIGVVAVVLIVGGAAWSEYRKAQIRSQAENLGDAIVTALSIDDLADRSAQLSAIQADAPGAEAVAGLLAAGAEVAADAPDAASETLARIAQTPDVPPFLVDLAAFKALLLMTGDDTLAERRTGFGALASPGAPLRLLAEEQLALLDIEGGDSAAAVERLQAILQDAETGRAQQERVVQLVLALGEQPVSLPRGLGLAPDQG